MWNVPVEWLEDMLDHEVDHIWPKNQIHFDQAFIEKWSLLYFKQSNILLTEHLINPNLVTYNLSKIKTVDISYMLMALFVNIFH